MFSYQCDNPLGYTDHSILQICLLAGGLTSAALSGLSPLVPGENDIDQLGKMTQILGSIENNWPGVQEMPDWGKVSFPNCPGRPLSDLLPGASEAALELLAGMIKWVIIDHVSIIRRIQYPWMVKQSDQQQVP